MTGITTATIKRWLSIAEACGLIYILPSAQPGESGIALGKNSKVYFCDTGLAAFLCGIASPEEMRRHLNAEAFFETFVIMEILKSYRHNCIEPKLYYYRNPKNQGRIDLLIYANDMYHPVEIKMSEFANQTMIRHFDKLKSLGVKIGPGSVICNCLEPCYLDDNVLAHSIWQI